MNKYLLVTLTAALFVLTGINASAADKAASKDAEEEESIYVQLATACQSQITSAMVPDNAQRQEQVSVCIEKGLDDNIAANSGE